MGLFNHFPYTNFQNLNIDWLLERVKALENYPNIINQGTLVVTINKSDTLNITADKTYADIKSAINDNIPIIIREIGSNGYKMPKVCTLWTTSALRLFLPDMMEYDDIDEEYDLLYNWYYEFKSDGTITEHTDRVTLTPVSTED